jgi:hypothetical protein
MFNPDIKYAHSKGVDLPLMYCYLAGYMSGEKLKETTEWRKQIRKHYREWEKKILGKEGTGFKEKYEWLSFPISFLDPYNGKEFETIDKKGLTSSIPANAIIHGDYMSVSRADIIIANMCTFGASRPMTGTNWELAWAWQMKKPFVLITNDVNYKTHPFTSQASWIVSSVEELLEKKILETFYRRMSGAIYE